MKRENLNELLYQALETEMGGVRVYETALRCAVNEDLKEEWEKYLEQTKKHVDLLVESFEGLGLDISAETPGRGIVEAKWKALVEAMEKAMQGEPAAAQLVAAECVVDAETKDHQNWELIGEALKGFEDEGAKALRDACEEVEPEEDEHLYHNQGWARELWMEALGLPAVLPPPEERRDVETAEGAAKAKRQRGRMVKRRPARRPRHAA